MAAGDRIRNKLRERAQPFLEPGETIQYAFPAFAGNPWMFSAGGALFMLLFAKPRDVVVTDRAIVLFRQSTASATPKEILARLPRNTQIGPVKGKLWGKLDLNGQKLWVARAYMNDVASADAA